MVNEKSVEKPARRKASEIRKELKAKGYYDNVRKMDKNNPLDPNIPEDYLLGKSLGLYK